MDKIKSENHIMSKFNLKWPLQEKRKEEGRKEGKEEGREKIDKVGHNVDNIEY